jgi:hypothetical protein
VKGRECAQRDTRSESPGSRSRATRWGALVNQPYLAADLEALLAKSRASSTGTASSRFTVLRLKARYITVEKVQRILVREDGAETSMPTMTVSGRKYELDHDGVEAALRSVLPEPIHEHFVVINGRRWPPKQVLSLLTGLDRADFTSHQARRALTRLGFPASRLVRRAFPAGVQPGGALRQDCGASRGQETLVEALRPLIGLWVAVRGDEVLVAAPTPKDVVTWLAQHGQTAQSMFRVTDSEQAIAGAAPR